MTGKAKIELLLPIEGEGRTIEAVELRRATVRDMRAATRLGGEAGMFTALLCQLAELSPDEVDGIDLSDMPRLEAQFAAFHPAPKERPADTPMDRRLFVDIALEHPVQHAGEPLGQVRLRRAKARDLKAANASADNQVEVAVRLISAMSGLPESAVDALDVSDFRRLEQQFQAFHTAPPTPISAAAS